jgi:predicted lipoprotein with Yx(FWY)xxD motif
MRKTSMLTVVLATGVLVLSGCGSDDDSGGGSTAAETSSAGGSSASAPSSPTEAATSAALLSTADSPDYGTIVTDGEGRTVYMFDKDVQGAGASSCSGQCLVAWPPVVAESATPEVDGVTGEVGTITRDDGTLQVTVAGWPLYYWKDDAAPGDATGQGVQGVWWVITPTGDRVTTPPPAP